eukprot:jgi/Botrbrau1/304/Bobra.0022s0270.1
MWQQRVLVGRAGTSQHPLGQGLQMGRNCRWLTGDRRGRWGTGTGKGGCGLVRHTTGCGGSAGNCGMYGLLTGMVVGGALPRHWRAAMEERGVNMHETQRLLREELQSFGEQRIREGTDVSEEFVRAVKALQDSETDVDMSAVAELVASAHQLTIAILRVMGGNVVVQIFTPANPDEKGRRLVCLWQQQELQQGQRGHFAGVRVREDMNVVQLQRTPGRVCQDVLEINCRAVPRHLSMMGKVGGGEPTGGLRASPAPVVPRPAVLPLASTSAVSTAGLSTAAPVSPQAARPSQALPSPVVKALERVSGLLVGLLTYLQAASIILEFILKSIWSGIVCRNPRPQPSVGSLPRMGNSRKNYVEVEIVANEPTSSLERTTNGLPSTTSVPATPPLLQSQGLNPWEGAFKPDSDPMKADRSHHMRRTEGGDLQVRRLCQPGILKLLVYRRSVKQYKTDLSSSKSRVKRIPHSVLKHVFCLKTKKVDKENKDPKAGGFKHSPNKANGSARRERHLRGQRCGGTPLCASTASAFRGRGTATATSLFTSKPSLASS